MKVRDLMTSPVHTIGPDAPVWEAMGLMRSHRLRRLPVVEDGALIGIVTWTDVVRVRPPALGGRWHVPNLAAGVLVRHLMTTDPVTVRPDAPIAQAAELMRRRKIGGLPVVEDGRLIGIVTESDLFDAFVDVFTLGPDEVRFHIAVRRVEADLPVVVEALRQAGIPILSLHTLRVHGTEVIDLTIANRDAERARGILLRLALDVDSERPLELPLER